MQSWLQRQEIDVHCELWAETGRSFDELIHPDMPLTA